MTGKTLNFGILGLNEGNGHPYSYSAIFNGYSPENLEKKCPFSLIKEYLPAEHRNEIYIKEANVTHVWTQDISISRDIASVSLIPEIVSEPGDMVGEIDGVIIARDDPENHLSLAEPFLDAGIPIYFDKLLASTTSACKTLLKNLVQNNLVMTGSGARYSKNVEQAKNDRYIHSTQTVHGISRVNWVRYGSHLIDPIVELFGHDVRRVRSLSPKFTHDIVQIEYRNGPNVILELLKDIHMPIGFRCFREQERPIEVLFDDYFNCYYKLMEAFTTFVKDKVTPVSTTEMIALTKIGLAGIQSKELGGDWVYLDEIKLLVSE